MTPAFLKSVEGAASVRDRDGLMVLSDEAMERGWVELACWLRFEAEYISSRGSPLPVRDGEELLGHLSQHGCQHGAKGLAYYPRNRGEGLPWMWWPLGAGWIVYYGADSPRLKPRMPEAEEVARARRACEAACEMALARWEGR